MENSNNVNVLPVLFYGATAGFQCSCMSLMSVCWRILNTIARWDNGDLDRILQNGDLQDSIFRLLGIERLPLNICGQAVRIELLENKTGKITLNTYLISLTKIVTVLIQAMVHCFL